MRISPFLVVGALVAGALAAPAGAATKKKPISKSYEATAPAPDPTNWLGQAGAPVYSVCAQTVPSSFHVHTFTAPAIGKLNIKVFGFLGDWDLLLTNPGGDELSHGGSAGINTPQSPSAGDEVLVYKIKKAKSKINIITCNWAGGPTAKVNYTFTYA